MPNLVRVALSGVCWAIEMSEVQFFAFHIVSRNEGSFYVVVDVCLWVQRFASSAPGVAETATASAAAAVAARDGGLARCPSVLPTVSKYYECMYEYAESTLLLLLLLLLWFLLVSRTKNTRENKIGVHTAPQNALRQAMRSRLNANNLNLSATNLQRWWRWWYFRR